MLYIWISSQYEDIAMNFCVKYEWKAVTLHYALGWQRCSWGPGRGENEGDTDLITGSRTLVLRYKLWEFSSVRIWENWQIYLKCRQHGEKVSDAAK